MESVIRRVIAKRSIHDDGTVFTLLQDDATLVNGSRIKTGNASFTLLIEPTERARELGLCDSRYRDPMDKQDVALENMRCCISHYLGRLWQFSEETDRSNHASVIQ